MSRARARHFSLTGTTLPFGGIGGPKYDRVPGSRNQNEVVIQRRYWQPNRLTDDVRRTRNNEKTEDTYVYNLMPVGGRFVAICEIQLIYVDGDHPISPDGISPHHQTWENRQKSLAHSSLRGIESRKLQRFMPPICPPGQGSSGRIGGRIRSYVRNHALDE